MPPNLGISFHYILNVVVRSIRLEYMSIPHGAPAPLIEGVGSHFKCHPLAFEMWFGAVGELGLGT